MTILCRLPPQSCPIQQARPYREQQQTIIFVPADFGGKEI
jgi:hypothetical protein